MNQSSYINQHFDECIDQINFRREDLIADINDYSDKLIRENESNRSQCLQNSAKTEALAKKIDFLKEEILDLKKEKWDGLSIPFIILYEVHPFMT